MSLHPPVPAPLPDSVRRFLAAAQALGLAVDVVMHREPARSAEQAASACGCDLGQIVKSLVFRGRDSGGAFLFLVSGRNRVDEARAAAVTGETIDRADAAFVRDATGFAIGGIPPFGHVRPGRVFMDDALLGHPLVWAAAGHPNAVFSISPTALEAATRATRVDL